MSWTVTCPLFVYIYLRRLFHYSMATFFDTAVVVAHSFKRAAAGSSCSFLVCIMVSIILLLLSETEPTLQPHRVLSITYNLHPLPTEKRNFQRHTWQTPAFHRGSGKTVRVPQDGLLWRSDHDAR